MLLHGIQETTVPRDIVDIVPITLDVHSLPQYASRTTLRMLSAMVISLLFTFVYATLAAKSRRLGMVLVPILDIMQSIPILGFLTFTVVYFMNLYPGKVIGAELAAIFAIFTSQVWNMTFSMYQSLCNIPRDLEEVSRSFRLSGWQKFWYLGVPFSMPGLVWNMMMSMSGGWFFVVASEMIVVGDTVIPLPGIGSYIALAIKEQDLLAILYAMLTMLGVIFLYDQLLFRPMIVWSNKFRLERTTGIYPADSWVLYLFRKTNFLRFIGYSSWNFFSPLSNNVKKLCRTLGVIRFHFPENFLQLCSNQRVSYMLDIFWFCVVCGVAIGIAWQSIGYIVNHFTYQDVLYVIWLGCITMFRVVVLIIIASIIWIPVGIWIGFRPHISSKIQPFAQLLAAFPANVFFPLVVSCVSYYHLNPNLWLSLLMIFGTQWYILFNVIAGASAFPNDFKEVASSFHITGWRWWRYIILPGIFPYYVTGAITACGGAWNASIVSEVASWGHIHLRTTGLGAYIAESTEKGSFPEVVLGVLIMCCFVLALNRFLWHPLYLYGTRCLRL
ncbi:ABC transporter permease subunit [Candidatus Liberibacter asiaticus]|nr:ABC transporter permease subunit [Candidatus Liberibacter asiaticus]AWL14566.1 sulfonate ABC transporter permease [Candidatus Liberibacter asiaticus]MBE2996621.1 ABC transporter permease subunit [Candidatus Liberibacter asiaticus]QLK10799.1 ABC transporter permease subunit [Candidatus Liberibacter asiaticus]QMV55219.1 ABC transporter permease subunit [Candidatus Liberibacter asiaticus]